MLGPERERAAGWRRGEGADFKSAAAALRASPPGERDGLMRDGGAGRRRTLRIEIRSVTPGAGPLR